MNTIASRSQSSEYDFTLPRFAKESIKWAIAVAQRILFWGKTQFIVVTPPMLQKQIIYDKHTRSFFAIHIRDFVDFGTMRTIYLQEDYALRHLARYKEIAQYYNALVSQGGEPLIIDCGANIGAASKYFSQEYPRAKIVGIEPDDANVEQARRNNDSPNVIVLKAAVASDETRGSIVNAGANNDGLRVCADGVGPIEMLSINSILASDSCRNTLPFIVKIDIEGFESELFSHNVEWIDTFPVLVIELHDWMLPRQGSSRSFLNEISRRDRDFICVGGNVFSISNTILP